MAEGIRFQDVFILIIYLIIIILAAYFLTKLVAKKSMQKGMKQKNNGKSYKKKYIKTELVSVVDRIPIDREKSMMVVEFEKHYYLMGVTATDFKILDKKAITQEEFLRRKNEAKEEQERQEEMINSQVSESFSKRFASSFKEVASNYFKKDKTPTKSAFNEKLQTEIKKDDEKVSSKKEDNTE